MRGPPVTLLQFLFTVATSLPFFNPRFVVEPLQLSPLASRLHNCYNEDFFYSPHKAYIESVLLSSIYITSTTAFMKQKIICYDITSTTISMKQNIFFFGDAALRAVLVT
jgi:hypothetical protein